VVVAVIWEIVGLTINDKIVWVPLSSIGSAAINLGRTGELWTDISVSMTEFALGFAGAVIIGVLIGALMASNWVARDLLEPWTAALGTVPIIALGPLFIVWWGIGLAPKVMVIALVGIFPVISNTFVGFYQVDSHLLEAVRSFGATRLQLYRKVRLPAALPSLMTGFRLSLRLCLVAVVVAELFGSQAGLGWLILNSAQNFDTADLFVGVLTISILGIIGYELLNLIERICAPWHQRENR
jgi:NitT/TauT family transport system permease protein